MASETVKLYGLCILRGGIVGYIVFLFVFVSSTILWLIFAKKWQPDSSDPEEVSLLEGFIRMLKWSPFIMVFHPLPWVIIFLSYFVYQIFIGDFEIPVLVGCISFFLTPTVIWIYQIHVNN